MILPSLKSPISFLSSYSKIFESIIEGYILCSVQQCLSETQHGFISGRYAIINLNFSQIFWTVVQKSTLVTPMCLDVEYSQDPAWNLLLFVIYINYDKIRFTDIVHLSSICSWCDDLYEDFIWYERATPSNEHYNIISYWRSENGLCLNISKCVSLWFSRKLTSTPATDCHRELAIILDWNTHWHGCHLWR